MSKQLKLINSQFRLEPDQIQLLSLILQKPDSSQRSLQELHAIIEILAQIQTFSELRSLLGASIMFKCAKMMRAVSVPANQIITYQTDNCTDFSILLEGKVAGLDPLSNSQTDAAEIYSLAPGSYFGNYQLLPSRSQISIRYQAQADSLLATISAVDLAAAVAVDRPLFLGQKYRLLKQFPAVSGLNQIDLYRLAYLSDLVSNFNPFGRVFGQGQVANKVYFLVKGAYAIQQEIVASRPIEQQERQPCSQQAVLSQSEGASQQIECHKRGASQVLTV